MNRFFLTSIFVVMSQVCIANAASELSRSQALSRISAAGFSKTTNEALYRLMENPSSEFIVEFSKGKTVKAVKPNNRSLYLKSKKNQYQNVKNRVLDKVMPYGINVVKDYSVLPMAFVRSESRQALIELLNNPEVVGVYENKKYSLTLNQSLPQIGQTVIESEGYVGDNTSVAIIDTGVDFTRAAFGSCGAPGEPGCRVLESIDIAPDDFQRDDSGHGTNVAGIVAGVAPGTSILAIDVFRNTPDGPRAYSQDIIDAITQVIIWQDEFNIVAMNLSLSRKGVNHTTVCTDSWLVTSFADARAVGIIPVVSAGNSGFLNGVADPACAPGAVSVGAVNNDDRIAWFSNRDDNLLTIFAPGLNITAAGITMSGTSQAAPHISGTIAIMRAPDVAPRDTLDKTVARMVNTGAQINNIFNNLQIPIIDTFLAVHDALDDQPEPLEFPSMVPIISLILH